MDLKLIEDALVLIEEGSLSAAAARRNVTQSAFSRRIRALEVWLDTPLVERLPNRIELTTQLIDREAELRSLQRGFQLLKENNSMRDRGLVVATQHSLAMSVFPEIYRKLKDNDAVGPIRLRTRNQDEVIAMFLKAEADLILTYQPENAPRLPFDQTVSQGVWRRDTLVPVVGGPLRFALSRDKQPEPDTPILAYPGDSEFGRIIRVHPQLEGLVHRKNTVLETTFAASMVALVKTGAGIGWVPQSLVREELSSGDIISLSQDYARIPLDVVLSAAQENKLGTKVLNALLANK